MLVRRYICIKKKLLYVFQQDAHEMFHVLTQTITEETMSYPGVVPLFEVEYENRDTGVI